MIQPRVPPFHMIASPQKLDVAARWVELLEVLPIPPSKWDAVANGQPTTDVLAASSLQQTE